VPSSLDTFDVETAADRFLEAYPMIGMQGRHDFARAVRAAIRATKEGRAA